MKKSNIPVSRAGFTLIELMVVTSLAVMLILAAAALFSSFMITRMRMNMLTTVRTQGQYALNQMEFLLRNATEIIPETGFASGCRNNMESITLRSIDGGVTRLFSETQGGAVKIASNSGTYLTSSEVALISGPTFTCSQPSDQSLQHVTITFGLRHARNNASDVRQQVQETFRTSVTVRSQ